MPIVSTVWREVGPWNIVILNGEPWTVLPSYPRGVFRIRHSDSTVLTVTPAPDTPVARHVPDEAEARELLHRELGAEEICPPFTSGADFQAHIDTHHAVPYVLPYRYGHKEIHQFLAWHRGLHAGQAGAPYALMSVPHTHEGLLR